MEREEPMTNENQYDHAVDERSRGERRARLAAQNRADSLWKLLEGMRDPLRIAGLLEQVDFRRAALQSLFLALAGSALFGLWTGLYAMTAPQFLASLLKAPLLLVGTTAICFPSFFVVQYVLAPRALSLRSAALLQASTLAIIASTWVVVALPCSLFIASAQNYAATKLLVTLVAGFGGIIGLGWFVRGFRGASSAEGQPGRVMFLLPYCVLFALVGTQLAWSLRPFLGSPSQEFTLFRTLGGNLFESLLASP
jgi:hypothetical protein